MVAAARRRQPPRKAPPTRSLRYLALATFAAIPVLLDSAPSGAGVQSSDYAYCQKYSDGSGQCGGTMLGFRNNSDPGAYAVFFTGNPGGTYVSDQFWASLNGQSYSCVVPQSGATSAAMTAIWPSLETTVGYWSVSWDAHGNCGMAYVYNDSADSRF
jgi:hypothetical protein